MALESEGEGGRVTGVSEEGAMDMDSLLQSESAEYRWLHRGDVIEGVVMGSGRDGILVDVGSKSEGLIPPHEAHSLGPDPAQRLSPGEKVLVYVLQPDTAEGQILLSIDRARGEKGWRVLQERFEAGEAFDARVSGFNKGGLLVNVEGVHAFVPLSQVVGARPGGGNGEGSLAAMVGKTLHLKVIEINRRRNRVILSERAALQEWRSQQKERLLAELHEGDIRRGKISSIRPFGVFVDLGGADGLAHLSELSWDRNRTPEELCKVGDEVDVYVMKVDTESKKIALSLRRAQPEQWEEIVDKYRVGQVVPGVITKLVTFGAFARIEGPIEGLVHVSELVDRRVSHPKEVAREGDILPLKIVRIERDRHRLGLSLRQAREEGEEMGFVFSPDGEVEEVPEELKERFSSLVQGIVSDAAGEAARLEGAVSEPQAEAPSAEAGIAEPPEAEAPAKAKVPRKAAQAVDEPVTAEATPEAVAAAAEEERAAVAEEEPPAEALEAEKGAVAAPEEPAGTPVVEAEEEPPAVEPAEEPSSAVAEEEPSAEATEAEKGAVAASEEPAGTPVVEAEEEASAIKPEEEPSSVLVEEEPSAEAPEAEKGAVAATEEPTGTPVVEAEEEPSAEAPEAEKGAVAATEEPAGTPLVEAEEEASAIKPAEEPSSVLVEEEPSAEEAEAEKGAVAESEETTLEPEVEAAEEPAATAEAEAPADEAIEAEKTVVAETEESPQTPLPEASEEPTADAQDEEDKN